MSSAQRGLDLWRSQHLPGSSDKQKERYVCGDVNTSLLRTAKGVTVMVQHDVVNPSARDARRNLIGTKGAVRGFSRPAHVYIEGMAEERGFALLDDYRERYQNRLWREFGSRAGEIGGHGGMDFIMAARLVECMRRGIAPDIDVYDTASWSAVGPLSEASVSGGSKSVGFPDFTRGHWERIRENLT